MLLPESANVGEAISGVVRAIEADKPGLRDVLRNTYNSLDNSALFALPNV